VDAGVRWLKCESEGNYISCLRCFDAVGWVAKRLLDPDAIWSGECGRLSDGCIKWVVIVEGEGAVLGMNLRLPTVTNGDFVE